jgi:SAM-dependent methyltransferase
MGARRRGRTDPAEVWERHAAWWQQHFTQGADPEYEEQILPLVAGELAGAARVLDVGTGEGQVARRAVQALGQRALVVGVDPTRAQLSEAVRRGGGPRYAAARAEALPFRDGAFDAVVVCLVLEHVRRLEAAVSELGRVLCPRGRLVLLLNHPLLQVPGSGFVDDRILGEQYWRVGPYLVEDESLEEVERGVFIPFVHRPLGRYLNALVAAGLVVTRMEEPAPPPGFLQRAAEYALAAAFPRLCYLRAEKLLGAPDGGARPGRGARAGAAARSAGGRAGLGAAPGAAGGGKPPEWSGTVEP